MEVGFTFPKEIKKGEGKQSLDPHRCLVVGGYLHLLFVFEVLIVSALYKVSVARDKATKHDFMKGRLENTHLCQMFQIEVSQSISNIPVILSWDCSRSKEREVTISKLWYQKGMHICRRLRQTKKYFLVYVIAVNN